MKTTIQRRLAKVRSQLSKHNRTAIIIPTADPHMSEYLPEHWQHRQWLSGFTGSAGTLVITQDYAGLWADSRYWIQAEAELSGTDIELQKWQKDNTYSNWLANCLPNGSIVEVNGNMISVADRDLLLSKLSAKKITLITTDTDSASIIYNTDNRPSLPTAPLYRHDPQFVSMSATEKLTKIRQSMQKQDASHHLISSLDDIGWLTNLRGADVDYNPVFMSHILISQDDCTLFINLSKVSTELKAELNQANVTLADYHDIHKAMSQLVKGDRLLIDANKVAVGTLISLDANVELVKAIAPSTFLKSIKSVSDIANIRESMRQDGVALCEFFSEFERRLLTGETLSELDVDSMLITYRSQQPHYVSPSFPTIAGYQGNGAIVHYRASEDSYRKLTGNGLLLIDSGAQYHNGTTDITRVVPISETGNFDNITKEQKRDFTAVLKSHIALATAHFPEGIASTQIDAICRAPLWALQMNYGHGTGHGVGYFMNVHEGPQGISYSAPAHSERAMRAGMITSNEPGLYRENLWGIRIENLVACVPVEKPVETDFGEFLYFETITYCPIDTRLVEKSMLTEAEVSWLNNYHTTVFKELSNRTELTKGSLSSQGLKWLRERTKAI